ncbi:MAG: type III-A CRISPR-associated RAMP protein Csm5 [Bacteroidetes bacterium]|nr:MAG: type III-A CRISPR-associated RAMP protein Csm5 [Bacteroidota bacterium]
MATATLTTLTPVHVGSGQKLLRNFDFIVEDGRVGFIDLEKVVAIIGIEQIAQLTAVIEKRGSLVDFLRKGRGLTNVKLEDICYRIASQKASGSVANELKEQYHTLLKGACIPGSSLKGAIKTFLWQKSATDDFLQSLRIEDFKNKRGKWDSENIDKKLFGQNANEKVTRFLKIGDVHFEVPKTGVYEVGIYNKQFTSWAFKEGQYFLAECLPIGLNGYFEFKIDGKWMNKNIEKHPEKWKKNATYNLNKTSYDFLKDLNTYTLDMLDAEIKELEGEGFANDNVGNTMLDNLDKVFKLGDNIERTQEPSAIVRLGGNSGWTFMTGNWINSVPTNVIDENNFTSIRKTIQRNKQYDMNLWPKTRKMTTKGMPLGFVKITIQP